MNFISLLELLEEEDKLNISRHLGMASDRNDINNRMNKIKESIELNSKFYKHTEFKDLLDMAVLLSYKTMFEYWHLISFETKTKIEKEQQEFMTKMNSGETYTYPWRHLYLFSCDCAEEHEAAKEREKEENKEANKVFKFEF